MNTVYYVFAIKCTKDDSFYLGVSTKKTANSIGYMMTQHSNDNTKYVKLAESVKKYGRGVFLCNRIGEYDTKEEAEQYIFDTLTWLPSEKVLNDSIISPDRVECEKCHQRIKVDFLQKHLEVFCKATAFKYLDKRFQEVQPDLVSLYPK